MKKTKYVVAVILTLCLCFGGLLSGTLALRAEAATNLNEWQGYWGSPIAYEDGVRVSTNATYMRALSPEYIRFDIEIGALDSDSQDWLKFGLGKVKADMDANGQIYVRIYNVANKLEMSLLDGATIIDSKSTDFTVGSLLSFEVKKQTNAEAWDISVNGTALFTTTKSFTNDEGTTYLGFASWADAADEDRSTDLYYDIKLVMDSQHTSGESATEGTEPEDTTSTEPSTEPGTAPSTEPSTDAGIPSAPSADKVQTQVKVDMDAWQFYWDDPTAGGFAPVADGECVKIITNATHKTPLDPMRIEFTLKIGKLKADSTDWIKFGFGDTTKDYDKWAGISFVLRNCGGKLGVEGLRPSVFAGIELDNVSVEDTLHFVFEQQENGVWSLFVNDTMIAELTNITATDFCDENGMTYLGFASWADVSDGTHRSDKLYYTITSLTHVAEATDEVVPPTETEKPDETETPGDAQTPNEEEPDSILTVLWIGCMVILAIAVVAGVTVFVTAKIKEKK